MKLKKIFFIIFVGIYTNIQAQGLKVTHMEGTYDLDGDGLKELLITSEDSNKDKSESSDSKDDTLEKQLLEKTK